MTSIALAYHERTKHRLDGYAAGPETLDWDAQPGAFRHYRDVRRVSLPLLSELPDDDPIVIGMARPFTTQGVGDRLAWSLSTLGVLLQTSLGITAWKAYGPDRWAVRANPSSGNLHPIEAYVIAHGLHFLADGIYHYDAEQHALECRASANGAGAEQASLSIALTSSMWREAWKYGERAFRYCQLDTGHASAALRIAGAALGARVRDRTELAASALASLLGIDRVQDYPSPSARNPEAELEEPELLLEVEHESHAASAFALPEAAALHYHGRASTIDPRPLYRWPIIREVALATRAQGQSSAPRTDIPQRQPSREATATSARTVLLGRRSAQRFDARHLLAAKDFASLLEALMPDRSALATPQVEPAVDLILFVHRVADLSSGLYVLPRRGRASADLLQRLSEKHTLQAVECGVGLPLQRLCTSESKQLMRVARAVHCHQDIAASACFAVGMIAELEPRVSRCPASYRDAFREAGAIGQLLYLHAEARGLRGTGIGCYFDDAVHELLGLDGSRYQSLYHFTVGRALDDPRIETRPAYSERTQP